MFARYQIYSAKVTVYSCFLMYDWIPHEYLNIRNEKHRTYLTKITNSNIYDVSHFSYLTNGAGSNYIIMRSALSSLQRAFPIMYFTLRTLQHVPHVMYFT